MLVTRRASCRWKCILDQIKANLAEIQPENHQNVQKTRFGLGWANFNGEGNEYNGFVSVRYNSLLYGYNSTRALIGCWAGIIFL